MQNNYDTLVSQFGVGGAFGIIFIAYALTVLPLWFIFKKANIASWKALIPIYNNYLLYKIAWEAKWFWILLGLSFLLGMIGSLTSSSTAFFLLFGATATCVLAICILLIELFFLIKLSKSFGHGTGFALGLIFLQIIFVYILAFDSKKYVGPEGVKAKKAIKAKK